MMLYVLAIVGDTFTVRMGGVDMAIVCDPAEYSAICRSPHVSTMTAVRKTGTAVPFGMFCFSLKERNYFFRLFS